MRIRWSPEAAEDLERITRYIGQDNPRAARQVVKTIYDGIGALRRFPPEMEQLVHSLMATARDSWTDLQDAPYE